MRIEWREESARAVATELERIRQALERSAREARQAEAALKEADPDGTNKRLKAIGERLRRATMGIDALLEDAEQVKGATNQMIQLFEGCEGEVIRLLRELDPGREREEEAGRTAAECEPAPIPEYTYPPRWLPRPRIVPMARMSALGPVLGWLLRLAEQ